MAKAHAKGQVRPDQPESTRFSGTDVTALQMAMTIGGGILPACGQYTHAVWAVFLGRSQRSVELWFDALDLPYDRLGDLRFFDAIDVRSALPRMTRETDPNLKKAKE